MLQAEIAGAEKLSTYYNSVDIQQKVLEDSETGEQEQETRDRGVKTGYEVEASRERENLIVVVRQNWN